MCGGQHRTDAGSFIEPHAHLVGSLQRKNGFWNAAIPSTSVDTQWNLAVGLTGTAAGFVLFDASVTQREAQTS